MNVQPIRAVVTTSPGLQELLEFPAVVQAATRFAADPAMDGSAFRAGFEQAFAREQNLSFQGVRDWLEGYFSSYREEVTEEVKRRIEVLSYEVHVPHVPGATATLTLADKKTDTGSFLVTLLGSGGGAKQTIEIEIEDETTFTDCTRLTHTAESTWEVVEVKAGPDRGRRYPRLVEVDADLTRSITDEVPDDRCTRSASPELRWRSFDYRRGGVQEGTPKLTIARTDAWLGKTGIKLDKLGLDARVETEVGRNATLEVAYRLPSGHLYESYRELPSPFAWWRVT